MHGPAGSHLVIDARPRLHVDLSDGVDDVGPARVVGRDELLDQLQRRILFRGHEKPRRRVARLVLGAPQGEVEHVDGLGHVAPRGHVDH